MTADDATVGHQALELFEIGVGPKVGNDRLSRGKTLDP